MSPFHVEFFRWKRTRWHFLCCWLLEWEAHDVSPGNADKAKHKKDEDKRPEAAVGVEGHPGVKDVDEDGVDEGDAEVDDEVPGKVGQPEDKRIHPRHQLNLPSCDYIPILKLRIWTRQWSMELSAPHLLGIGDPLFQREYDEDAEE